MAVFFGIAALMVLGAVIYTWPERVAGCAVALAGSALLVVIFVLLVWLLR